MVAASPLLRSWSVKKFNATIINDIWVEVLFFTLIATMVSTVSMETKHNLGISNQMLTVLGTVLGLVISFRTTSAYERYQDGRKMWTNISIASRNISQMIWIHVPNNRKPYSEGQRKPSELDCIIEKKTMINLVQAFAVSVKHFLRGEHGIYYQDLYPLVCMLPRYANESSSEDDLLPLWRGSIPTPLHSRTNTSVKTSQSSDPTLKKDAKLEKTSSLPTPDKTDMKSHSDDEKSSWYNSFRKKNPTRRHTKFDPERALPVVMSDQPLKPARNPPQASFFDYFPILRILKPVFRLVRLTNKSNDSDNRTLLGRKKQPDLLDSNVPLEITLFLSSYLSWLLKGGLLTPAIATGLVNNISSLQDTMSNLDRIRNTPIPFAYQAHLRMSLWLYLLLLPFQMFNAFKYLTIPFTAFASFLLLGFLEIGQEIENPFNYDLNDLDLDSFCLSIQRELAEITAHTSPEPGAFVFSAWNQPFAPSDRRTAEQIMAHNSDHPNHIGHKYCLDEEETEKGLPSIRRTLLKSWRDVDQMTRHHHHQF